MNKGSIQEEDITTINIYAPNIGASQYVRHMLTSMKGKINSNTIIVGDLKTSLTWLVGWLKHLYQSVQSLSRVRLFRTPWTAAC